MDFVILWFILTNGSGYLAPMEVRLSDSIIQCDIDGTIIGVQVEKLENPNIVLWPDPKNLNKHCKIDISAMISALPIGEYHLATTTVGTLGGESYILHDPHTSVYWIKSNNNIGNIPGVINVRVQ